MIALTASVAATVAPFDPLVATACAGAGPHRAALVVEHADGSVVTRCVSFSSSTISGEQLLGQSGISYATVTFGGFGDAVCQIDGEPATFPASCWSGSSPYWSMFVSRADGPWATSSLGVSSQTFRNGDAEGFRYEAQTGVPAVPPSPVGVCTPSSPAPTPSAIPRPTVRPTPPATPRPTIRSTPTSAPSASKRPRASPSSTPVANVPKTSAPPPHLPPSPSPTTPTLSAVPSGALAPGTLSPSATAAAPMTTPAASPDGTALAPAPADGPASMGGALAVVGAIVILALMTVGLRGRARRNP